MYSVLYETLDTRERKYVQVTPAKVVTSIKKLGTFFLCCDTDQDA